MRWPLRIACLLMLPPTLAGCLQISRSPTTVSDATEAAKAEAVAQAQTGATFCQIANKVGPLLWSKDDTRETQLWAVSWNRLGRERCGWKPPGTKVGIPPTTAEAQAISGRSAPADPAEIPAPAP